MLDMTSDSSQMDTVGLEYYSLEWYDRVVDIVRFWTELGEIPPEMVASPEDRATAERLLFAEARFLDQERLEEWLGLFTDDATYWIPSDVKGRDPRKVVTWEMNDRRRLEERVERLNTDRAYSQAPPTRTAHIYSNIEVLSFGPDLVHVISKFLIQTSLVGRISQRAGWNGYILRKEYGEWKIALKRIQLYDADHPQDNNSFTL